jgi:2-iminobutanoate/2-iminopropanoate deaminase
MRARAGFAIGNLAVPFPRRGAYSGRFPQEAGMKRIFLFVLLAAALASAGDSAPRKHLNVPNHFEGLPFSDAVLAGDTLYLSGRIGLTAERKPPEKIEDEVRLLMASVQASLAQAGMTMDDLVSVTIYCPDLSLYDRFNAVYRTYFTDGRYPARAFIGSGPLLFGGHFELTAIAVRRPPAGKKK